MLSEKKQALNKAREQEEKWHTLHQQATGHSREFCEKRHRHYQAECERLEIEVEVETEIARERTRMNKFPALG